MHSGKTAKNICAEAPAQLRPPPPPNLLSSYLKVVMSTFSYLRLDKSMYSSASFVVWQPSDASRGSSVHFFTPRSLSSLAFDQRTGRVPYRSTTSKRLVRRVGVAYCAQQPTCQSSGYYGLTATVVRLTRLIQLSITYASL